MTRETENISILTKSQRWVVLDKPAGLETVVKGGGNTRFCFTSLARRRLGIKALSPCHRLDRDTSGCLLYAADEESLPLLESAFRDHLVTKSYLAIILGTPPTPEGNITLNLSRWSGGHKPVTVVRGGGGLEAETRYRVLATGAPTPDLPRGLALLLFSPKTGRTHQIRVHAAALNCPILGDDQYGDRRANQAVKERSGLSRQALHSWKLALPGIQQMEKIRATALLPADMATLLDLTIPGWLSVLKKG